MITWPRKTIDGFLALGLLAGLFATPEARQAPPQARTPIDVSKLGPQVGQHIPPFSLKDQNGTIWTDASVMGPKGAMLVFFRSADW